VLDVLSRKGKVCASRVYMEVSCIEIRHIRLDLSIFNINHSNNFFP